MPLNRFLFFFSSRYLFTVQKHRHNPSLCQFTFLLKYGEHGPVCMDLSLFLVNTTFLSLGLDDHYFFLFSRMPLRIGVFWNFSESALSSSSALLLLLILVTLCFPPTSSTPGSLLSLVGGGASLLASSFPADGTCFPSFVFGGVCNQISDSISC
jgi:hypothetical protein